MVWPLPPNEPKIEFLTSFSNSTNIGIKKSFLRKIWDRVIGNDPLEEMLIQPIGITGDNSGNIYVADPGSQRVHIFNPTQKTYNQIRGKKGKPLKTPIGIAVSDSGLVYISDSELGEIQVFNADRNYQFTIKGYFQRPTGICINQDALYVTDTGLHKVFIFDLDGVYLFEFGNQGINQVEFNRPIFIAKKGLFYITDAMNFRVQVFSPEGVYQRNFGLAGNAFPPLDKIKGIALDSEGHIYVTDSAQDMVKIHDSDGRLLLFFGKKGYFYGDFYLP